MSESGFNNEMWTSLLEHIVEGRNVPKLQVERAIGPILGFFIEDVTSALLGVDRDSIVLLAPEFPLKKSKNRQSNNVDWLIYKNGSAGNNEGEIILFELKTADSSFNDDQLSLYRKLANSSSTPIWESLYSNYKEIAKSGHWKYKRAKENIDENKEKSKNIDSAKARIIYLCPEVCIPEEKKDNECFFSFKDLAGRVEDRHPPDSALATLCEILRKLDISNKPHQIDSHVRRNFVEEVSLEEIVNQANTYGSDIVIGYMGGQDKLLICQPEELKKKEVQVGLVG